MALYLLNCSVDAPDARSRWKSENLAYNEQESIVELLVEKAFGLGDVIPEFDDTDCDEGISLKKSFSVDHFILPAPYDVRKPFEEDQTEGTPFRKGLNPQDFPTFFSPPPEI